MKSFGAPVDMISEETQLADYPFVIIPAYQQVDKNLVNDWVTYAKNGGHLIITCRTGSKTREGHLWEGKFSLPIHELIGAEIEGYDQIIPSQNGTAYLGEKKFTWNNWTDILTITNKDVETWAELTDQFYAPKPAVISRKIGKGTVTYIAVDTDDGSLEKTVLEKVFNNAMVPIENHSQGIYVNWRDGFWIGVNYTSEMQEISIPENAEILVGEKDLAPAGVVVWKD